MSEFALFDFFDVFNSDEEEQQRQANLEREARREANHRAYLKRKQKREKKHQEYLERKARREANRIAYFERITSNVKRFRDQYEQIINKIKQQDLETFIQTEFDETCQKIEQLDDWVAMDDIEAARDLSLEIGQSIFGLIPLARKEKKRVERKEAQIQKNEKEKREEEIRKQAREDFIEQMKKNLETEKASNPEAVQEAVQNLEHLKGNADSLSSADLQDQLIAECDQVDGKIADETVRRQVIKAIYQSLGKTGFIVTPPQLKGDIVLLKAQKPAGQRAEFTVKLDGGLTFKFDNYEGQKCRQDIDQVTALLSECYGVKLSNRKVLWSNPDRIQKGSKDNPAGGQTRSMNR